MPHFARNCAPPAAALPAALTPGLVPHKANIAAKATSSRAPEVFIG